MENEIRERLTRYLAGQVRLAELEAWLLAETWDLNEEVAPEAAVLAYSALLAIAERGRDHLSEREVRARLWSLALTAHLGEAPRTTTGSSSSTHRAELTPSQFAVAGRRSEAVPA